MGVAKENPYPTTIYILCFSEMPQKRWPLIKGQHGTGWQLQRKAPPSAALPGQGQADGEARADELGDCHSQNTRGAPVLRVSTGDRELLPTISEAPGSVGALTLQMSCSLSKPEFLYLP